MYQYLRGSINMQRKPSIRIAAHTPWLEVEIVYVHISLGLINILSFIVEENMT